MNGTDIFVDTNICIYLLNGDPVLTNMLQDLAVYISIITEIELYSYRGNDEAAIKTLDSFIQSVYVINVDDTIKQKAINIRKTTKLKLPDSIIAGSALTYDLPLLTADKDFQKADNLDLILYK